LYCHQHEKGDKVAVMATSAGIKNRFPAAFEKGIERLEERCRPNESRSNSQNRKEISFYEEQELEDYAKIMEKEL